MTRSNDASTPDPAFREQPRDELRVVDHLVAAAELRIFVAQRIERVRVAGDDARDAEPVERADQRRRQLLEQHLVAGAAHAFAGRRFGCAEYGELDAGLAQDRDDGAGDLLAARVEGLGGADVKQVIEFLHLFRRGDDRHAQVPCPVRARVGGKPPRIALRLVGGEDRLELMRELAVHHHPVLAHAEESRQMLELDRAGGLAVAARRARPQRVLADHAADERRQRIVRGLVVRRCGPAVQAGGA